MAWGARFGPNLPEKIKAPSFTLRFPAEAALESTGLERSDNGQVFNYT